MNKATKGKRQAGWVSVFVFVIVFFWLDRNWPDIKRGLAEGFAQGRADAASARP